MLGENVPSSCLASSWSRLEPSARPVPGLGQGRPGGTDREIPGRHQVTDTRLGRARPVFTKGNQALRPSAGRSV